MNPKFEEVDYWKAIVLYGLNQATYKIALGKTLLEMTSNSQTTIDWHTLSESFLDNYIERLSINPTPQQSNPSRQTVLERIISQLNLGLINKQEAIQRVGLEGLNDVVPRFQTIGNDTSLVANRFYHFDHGKHLYLKDSLFEISESRQKELLDELGARWSLLEGAFKITQGNYKLTNDIREIYLLDGYTRTSLTSNIPFLKGYQGNTCFYCGQPVSENDIHVDHVLPRQVLQHDEIWNLVLSHSVCNLNKDDSLVGKHYLEKLMFRNENIMGSNHPWKKKISDSLGDTKPQRIKSMLYHYENVKTVLNGRYWENNPTYNRENDPFFSKLITQLNNR
jgi:hypothetical protein